MLDTISLGFDSPLRQEISICSGPALESAHGETYAQDDGGRLTSLTCIKCWRGQPSDQNSTGELANGKFYAVDTTACLRTLLSSARG